MRTFLEVSFTGLTAVFLQPLRSVVSVLAVVAVLLPYLVGLELAKGIEAEAEASARFGADLYVSGMQFSRPVPIPLRAVADLKEVYGVTDVVPRIIGEVVLGRDQVHAVLVGLPPEHLTGWDACMYGELPQTPSPQAGANELVIGTALARRLNLKIGSTVSPFYHNDRGERLSRVVGIFKADAPMWQANLILTTFATAESIFNQAGLATDMLITCRPGYQDSVSQSIEQYTSLGAGQGTIQTRVTSREELLALLPRGLAHREGIFNLHFLLAFVVAILVLMVTSGLGLSERRREIGILKATGWQTDEILLRSLVESLALALIASCSSLILAWVWLRVFNGYGIAGLFLPGADATLNFQVPYRSAPVPTLLAFVLSFVVVLTGTLYSSWRAATVSPREAMR